MKRVYIFKRTFTEVRTFAVPANSWEDAKLQIEDENYAETVRLNKNIIVPGSSEHWGTMFW